MSKYKETNGTSYHAETPNEVISVLERCRQAGGRPRIRVHYGDVQTGRDWGDVYDVAGQIGRSLGPVKIPLLVHSRRSMGGSSILDHCIVRIRFANRKDGGDLYRHPSYTPPAKSDHPNDWAKHFA